MTTSTPVSFSLATFGAGLIPNEERTMLLSQMGQLVFIHAFRKAWQVLDTPSQERLATLLEASVSDPEDAKAHGAVEAFLTEHVPEWHTYVQDEVHAIEEGWRKTYGAVVS